MSKLIDWSIEINNKELQEVINVLKQNGIIVFPTETVFGIGCNAFNEEAVRKLYKVKKRPSNKPISVLVSDINEIEKIAKINNEIEKKIIENFMPGPLTIILEKKESIKNIVTAQKNTIGVRIPDNEVAKTLLKKSGFPLATSSANLSGCSNEKQIVKIMQDFGESVDIFINGKVEAEAEASTIVQVINEKPIILRQGKITIEQINEAIKK